MVVSGDTGSVIDGGDDGAVESLGKPRFVLMLLTRRTAGLGGSGKGHEGGGEIGGNDFLGRGGV